MEMIGKVRRMKLRDRFKYAGMSANELKRVKELEVENAKLKRMYAELALENTSSRLRA